MTAYHVTAMHDDRRMVYSRDLLPREHDRAGEVGLLGGLLSIPTTRSVNLRDGSAYTIIISSRLIEKDAEDPACYLTQSQHTDTRPTSPGTVPMR